MRNVLFRNSTFLLTGTFKRSRDELKQLIRFNGGEVVNNLNKKVTHLLCGSSKDPQLVNEARSLHVRILCESSLQTLLKEKKKLVPWFMEGEKLDSGSENEMNKEKPNVRNETRQKKKKNESPCSYTPPRSPSPPPKHVGDDRKELLTPLTKIRKTKEFVLQARNYEREGNYPDAIECYNKGISVHLSYVAAMRIFPENPKLHQRKEMVEERLKWRTFLTSNDCTPDVTVKKLHIPNDPFEEDPIPSISFSPPSQPADETQDEHLEEDVLPMELDDIEIPFQDPKEESDLTTPHSSPVSMDMSRSPGEVEEMSFVSEPKERMSTESLEVDEEMKDEGKEKENGKKQVNMNLEKEKKKEKEGDKKYMTGKEGKKEEKKDTKDKTGKEEKKDDSKEEKEATRKEEVSPKRKRRNVNLKNYILPHKFPLQDENNRKPINSKGKKTDKEEDKGKRTEGDKEKEAGKGSKRNRKTPKKPKTPKRKDQTTSPKSSSPLVNQKEQKDKSLQVFDFDSPPRPSQPPKAKKIEGKLMGTIFVIQGKFSLSRTLLTYLIEQEGGSVVRSLKDPNVTHLLFAGDVDSVIFQEARQREIHIVEESFIKYLMSSRFK